MVESKDNVKVAVRIRPLNDRELQESTKRCVSITEECRKITLADHKSFTYDYVADELTSQEKLFEMVGRPIAGSCMSGYNGTIFAYGQTGSGKTFTIQGLGTDDNLNELLQNPNRGVLPRCFEYIFGAVSSALKSGNTEFLIKCSYLEIYQEQINDLLDSNPHNLLLREDMKKGPYVEGLIEEKVSNLIQIYNLLKIGSRNRHVSSTSMNKESSRSHSVFTLYVESKSTFDGLTNFKSSRFNLIDLAGSERQKSTACLGDRLKEAGMINKSLSALGNVINSLVEVSEGRQRHIPYRDSKLTFLLKDSLGGNSKTFIIANISPAISSLSETLSTLKFAQRAKLIKNSAVINEDTSGTVQMLKAEVKRLKAELEALQQLAQVAVAQCPKCSGLSQVDLPNLLSAFEKNTEAEQLLEHNLRIRVEHEKNCDMTAANKDLAIENLRSVVGKLENKIVHDKMILKFRDATIAKLQNGEIDSNVESLRKENEILRQEIENNPITAKLSAENKILNEEIAEMRLELENGYGSLRQQNAELKNFTEKLCENLKSSNLEREKLKMVFKELTNGADLNEILKSFEDSYEVKINDLSSTLRDLQKEHSQVLAENQMIHMNYLDQFEGDDNLLDSRIEEPSPRISLRTEDEYRRLEREMEELKLKLLSESQAMEKIFIEKRALDKQVSELLTENSHLKAAKEKLTAIEGQVEVLQTQVEEKYAALEQSTQEVENLTDTNDVLKEEVSRLTHSAHESKARIVELENLVNQLEKKISEQSNLIQALHEPTGNKTLALALSEAEAYKKRTQELESELAVIKKTYNEIQVLNQNLNKKHEATLLDLNAANETLIEFKQKLIDQGKEIEGIKDRNVELEEEIENIKELAERDKNHANILRERTVSKYTENLQRVNQEKNELEKEIDSLKNKLAAHALDLQEARKEESDYKIRLNREIKKSEIVCKELIDVKVDYESQLKVASERIYNLKDELEKVEDSNSKLSVELEEIKSNLELRQIELNKTVEQYETTIRIINEEAVKKEKVIRDEFVLAQEKINELQLEKSNILRENESLIIETQNLRSKLEEIELVYKQVEDQKKILEISEKELKESLVKLNSEKQGIIFELEKTNNELKSVVSERDLLSIENQKVLYDCEEFQVENNLLKIEKSNFEFELKQLTQEKEKLKIELDVSSAENIKLKDILNETKINLKLNEDEKISLTKNLENIKNVNLELSAKIESLTKFLDEEQTIKNELYLSTKILESDLSQSQKKLEISTETLKKQENDVKVLQENIKILEIERDKISSSKIETELKLKEVSQLKQVVEITNKENLDLISELEEKLKLSETTNNDLNSLISEKSNLVFTQQSTIEKLNQRNEESTFIIKTNEENLKSTEISYQNEIKELKNKIIQETETLQKEKEKTIQELSTKIQNLGSELQLKNLNFEEVERKFEESIKKIEITKIELQQKEKEIDKILALNEDKNLEIESLKKDIENKIKAHEISIEALREQEIENYNLASQTKEKDKIIEDLSLKADESRIEINELEIKIKNFELNLEEKQRYILNVDDKIKSQSQEIEQLELKNSILNSERENLVESKTKLEQEIETLNIKLNENEKRKFEILEAKSKVDEIADHQTKQILIQNSKVNELVETVNELEGKNKSLCQENEALLINSQSLEVKISENTKIIEENRVIIDKMKQELLEHQDKQIALETKLKTLDESINQKDNEIKDCLNDNLILNNESSRLQDEIKCLHKDKLNYIQNNECLSEQIRELNNIIQGKHETIESFKIETERDKACIKELEYVKEHFIRNQENQEQTIEHLKKSIEHENSKFNEYYNLAESLKSELASKSGELQENLNKLNENKEEIKLLNQKVEEITSESSKSQEKLSSTLEELKFLNSNLLDVENTKAELRNKL